MPIVKSTLTSTPSHQTVEVIFADKNVIAISRTMEVLCVWSLTSSRTMEIASSHQHGTLRVVSMVVVVMLVVAHIMVTFQVVASI